MTDQRRSLRYVPALDGLRALAAITVIGYHTSLPGFTGGALGVEVFFVLSGYLITTLLCNEACATGRVRLGAFWWRRLVRLYPELLLVVAVFAIAIAVLQPTRSVAPEAIAAVVYLADYFRVYIAHSTFTLHTWSLAVEMHFYLLWPFVVLWLVRVPRRTARMLLVLAVMAATLWRLQVFWHVGHVHAYYATDARIAGLMTGALIAFLPWHPRAWKADGIAVLGFAILAVLTIWPGAFGVDVDSWPGLVLDAGAALVVIALASDSGAIARVVGHPAVARIGIWSYGLYLWHYPISRVAKSQLPSAAAFVVTLMLGLMLAAASYHFVAAPAKKWYEAHRMAHVNQPAAA